MRDGDGLPAAEGRRLCRMRCPQRSDDYDNGEPPAFHQPHEFQRQQEHARWRLPTNCTTKPTS